MEMRRISCLLRLSLLPEMGQRARIFMSTPFSQFLRLRRLCSEDEDFHTKSLEMRDFFVQRGYPTSLLDTAFSKASQIPRSETLTNPVTNVTENNQILLVLTFHPYKF